MTAGAGLVLIAIRVRAKSPAQQRERRIICISFFCAVSRPVRFAQIPKHNFTQSLLCMELYSKVYEWHLPRACRFARRKPAVEGRFVRSIFRCTLALTLGFGCISGGAAVPAGAQAPQPGLIGWAAGPAQSAELDAEQ